MHDLNHAQKEAALHQAGPLLIVAGAGAGKTKTLTQRIANLIAVGVPVEKILAVTFTNKAAEEMRERIKNALPAESWGVGKLPFIGTFHSLGLRIIKENSALLGLPQNFSILDEKDSVALIKESLIDLNHDPKQYEPRKIKSIISRLKGDFKNPEDALVDGKSHFEKIVLSVWQRYKVLSFREKALDFDDLLLESTRLLKENPEVLKKYCSRWQYLHVDEYQDTNQVQYELCRMLAQDHRNICVVGDSDQNIYGWRGANLKNILNFEKDYPEAKVVVLEENYRSTKNILEAANEVIRKNKIRKEKNLYTKNGSGEKIALLESVDEKMEAAMIAEISRELIESGVPANEIAVLYRANFQSRGLEEAMIEAGLPYQVIGVRFFERKEIKDIVSYLRAAFNREGLSDLRRIINFPPRGLGKTTVAKIFSDKKSELNKSAEKKISEFYKLLDEIREYASNHLPSETLRHLIKKSGMEEYLERGTEEDRERLENIKELVTFSLKYDHLGTEGLEKMLDDIALSSDQDEIKEEEKVRLLTVHAAKGLEFSYVFIAGLEQDLFPHQREFTASPEDREEERRLFYVALTRAKKKVFLSWANWRTIFGQREVNSPSEFIYDVPEHLLEHYGQEFRAIQYD
jgi:DNA helicase-2/ATP-dependent DNA helicase PcrA